jgi:HD-like signal output (HDOD) protein
MWTAPQLVARVHRLASLPAVYLEVKRVLDDPNGSLGQLAAAMATDPAMTARVLRVVNSPFYGHSGRIETVTRALTVLGMQHVHDIVLAWAVSSAFADFRTSAIPMEDFWRKSALRAIGARLMARRAGFIDAERLFVEGLLSDIGHLVMYAGAPGLALQAREQSADSGRPLDEVEREIVGCDYAEVGAALMAAWSLPLPFHEPIACQVDPTRARVHRPEASIVHLAAHLADAGADAPIPPSVSRALQSLAIEPAALSALRDQANAELQGVLATFFPHLSAA